MPCDSILLRTLSKHIFQIPAFLRVPLDFVGKQTKVLLRIKAVLGTVQAQSSYVAHVHVAISAQGVGKQGRLVPCAENTTERVSKQRGLTVSPFRHKALQRIKHMKVINGPLTRP
mmetsp:Transcript_115993/g.173322  ORF Transcript_115993/g.173322 Transcript_115993/m.173322 type:complete len:115 (-) Transcript_115993:797-1141(-)